MQSNVVQVIPQTALAPEPKQGGHQPLLANRAPVASVKDVCSTPHVKREGSDDSGLIVAVLAYTNS